MSMYKLAPSFPLDFEVNPKEICYRIAPYHQSNSSNSQGTASGTVIEESDPVKVLEQKQLLLIEKLKQQSENLSKLLAASGKSASTSKPTTTAKPAKSDNAEAPKDGKKDKDAKKEARKAAKAEAKTKVAAGEAPAPKGKSGDSGSIWSVEDDRKTWETNMSLTVNLPSAFVAYPQEALGKVTIQITKSDESWVQQLAKIGQKRNVSFGGHVSNKVGKEAKTEVTVKSGNKFEMLIDKTTIQSRITAWKLLGAALGLFSRKSQQTLSSAHQSLWLKKADSALNGKADLVLIERDVSKFLARFDSLSSQWDVTIADVILRSLLDNSSNHPNNVEIWAKKIDTLSQ